MMFTAALLLAGLCLVQANYYAPQRPQQYYHYPKPEYTTYKVPLHHYETTTTAPHQHYYHHQTVKPDYYQNGYDYKTFWPKKPIVVQPFYTVQKYTTTPEPTYKPTYKPYYTTTTTTTPKPQHYPSKFQYTNPHLPHYNYENNYHAGHTGHQYPGQVNYQHGVSHPTNDYSYHHGSTVHKPEATTESHYEHHTEYDEHKPATYDHKPSTHDQKPSTYDQRPSSYDYKPSTYDQKPASYDQKPVVSNYEVPKPTVAPYKKPVNNYGPGYNNYNNYNKYPKEEDEDELVEAKNRPSTTTAQPAPKEEKEIIQPKEEETLVEEEDIVMPTEDELTVLE